MRPYEVVVIVDAGLEDDVIKNTVDRWGKRRFAYELKHRWEGYYALLDVVAEPAVMADLDRMLSLADEVIRHKIIRLPDGVAGRSASAAPTAETADATA